jgi:predicted signal transduction protein with EAL and GGDEF domain
VLARLGGDELLVLLDESPGPAATLEAVEAMVAPLAVPFDVGGETMVVTASVGVLHQADGRSSPGDLLRWVDLAMYRAKAFGGDTIEMDDPADRAGQSSRMRRVAELRQAVRDEELLVHYQGEWDLESGQLLGAEALARWDHPAEGLLVASEFIPLAEATGLIDELGARVLREACRTAAPWAEKFAPGDFVLRVNIARSSCAGRRSSTRWPMPWSMPGCRLRRCASSSPRAPCWPTRRARPCCSPGCAAWAWAWPSTTSAPATRPSSSSSSCR